MCLPTLPFGLVSLRLVANAMVRPTVRIGGRRSSAADISTMVVFDVACLTEQPNNKLRLHTEGHGVTVTRVSRDVVYE